MKGRTVRLGYRRVRVRERLRERAPGRPRLSVHRSLKYIYAQVIDDARGRTLAFASSLSKEIRGEGRGGAAKAGKSVATAKAVGELIAKKAILAGVKRVAFDRGGRLYHGRVKALADAARAAGLEF